MECRGAASGYERIICGQMLLVVFEIYCTPGNLADNAMVK